MLLALLLQGCWLLKAETEPVAAGCDVRAAFYADVDGDGHGDALDVYVGCEAPAGRVDAGDDCDDADASVWDTCGDTGADSGS